MYVVVEKIGRAGSPQNRAKKQEEWDKKYGKINGALFINITAKHTAVKRLWKNSITNPTMNF